MDDREKALRKFSEKERLWSMEVISRIIDDDVKGLDIKKLKGSENIFRVRKGDIRIIYRRKGKEIFILDIGRRNEKTYQS
jgi:mRNA-degrading endonuclease RelE of RelBE toxin-antitoxin system